MTYTVEFEPIGIRLICEEPLTVFEAARQAGVSLRSICGGKGTCGKCAIRIRQGIALHLVEAEREHLSDALLAEGWRLACRTVVTENITIYIPPGSLEESQVVQTEGVETTFAPRPAVRLLPVVITPPSLSDQASDMERLAAGLHEQHGVRNIIAGLPALRALRTALRETDWQISAALRGDEIIAAYPRTHDRAVGLAVDIGTTKLACYLVDLESG
ncbi:MAG: 2Fe-2S iron-sulfur cluster binding domain-containing protein, partial [Deltaproteobacteria bacterium]|nr:2Fe-2S iron-sulfur cluster binding domain-containing protein [Deltaproteobacteria bacterium]